jgi:hypothetical protein
MRPGRLLAVLAASFAAFGVTACRPPAPPPKGAILAVWNGVESAALDHSELSDLVSGGVRELFYEVAEVTWESGAPRLRESFAPALPHAAAATLVVTGLWNRPAESARQTAASWNADLGALILAAERRGATPVGIHFDLETTTGLEELAAALRRLRRELPASLHLSLGIEPQSLFEGGAEDLVRAVDFVVVTIYGQAPGEEERPERWDLEAAQPTVARLEEIGAPYALAGWTLGGARHLRRDGSVAAHARSLPLGVMLRSRQWEAKPGSVFQGLGRQVLELAALVPVRIGGWAIARGESVRMVRPNTADIERFLDFSAPAGARLGGVLRRLPAAGEELSLSVDNLREALRPGAAEPTLRVRIEPLAPVRGRTRLRLVLENRGDEPTDFGTVETNYVELRLPRGVLRKVDLGGFVRGEQLWKGRERRTVRALRQADTLRLYAAYVGGGERLASGPIEVAGVRSLEQVRVSGRFLVPGGRELELEPREVRVEAVER